MNHETAKNLYEVLNHELADARTILYNASVDEEVVKQFLHSSDPFDGIYGKSCSLDNMKTLVKLRELSLEISKIMDQLELLVTAGFYSNE